MNTNNDTDIMRQMAARQSEATKNQKQTAVKTPPATSFSAILVSQKGGTTSSKLLKQNPVGGAEVVRGAISSARGSKAVATTATSGATSTGTSTSTGDVLVGSGSATGTSSASDGQALLAATQQMQEMSQDFNLQYLSLQENMQAESRQYTAMSNVSKTKSDTAKNSLSNVK